MWNRTDDKVNVKITWIRHGMTKANEEHRYLGKTDEPLSEKGIHLLEEKKREYNLDNSGFLYTSAMKRCVQTAEILFSQKPIVIPSWREMDFGLFEGKNYEDLRDNADYQKWIDSNGTLPFPGGESRESFIRRSMEGFEEMLADVLRHVSGDTSGAEWQIEMPDTPDCDAIEVSVAAVVHGGTIMAVLSTLTGGEYFDFQLKNGESYETVIQLEKGSKHL